MISKEVQQLRHSCWEAKEEVPDDTPIDIGDRIILCFVSVKKTDGKNYIIRYLHYAKDGMVYMRRGTTARLQHFTRLGDDSTLDRTFYLNCLYEIRKGYDSCRWPHWANPGMQFVAIRHPETSEPWIAIFYPGTKEEKRFVVNKPNLDDVIRRGVVPTAFCVSMISARKNIPQAEYSFPRRRVPQSPYGEVRRRVIVEAAEEPEAIEKSELSEAAKKVAKETKEMCERDALRLVGYTDHDIDGPHPDDQVPKISCLICSMIVPAKRERAHWWTKECQRAKIALPQEPVKLPKPMGGDSVQIDMDEVKWVRMVARGEI